MPHRRSARKSSTPARLNQIPGAAPAEWPGKPIVAVRSLPRQKPSRSEDIFGTLVVSLSHCPAKHQQTKGTDPATDHANCRGERLQCQRGKCCHKLYKHHESTR